MPIRLLRTSIFSLKDTWLPLTNLADEMTGTVSFADCPPAFVLLMLLDSSDDTSPAATKPSRVDVGAAHDEGGAAEQVEVAMVQERNVSSTAPNSPPAF